MTVTCILTACNEASAARLLSLYLQTADNLIYEAYSAEQALELLERKQIDLAIIDITMPNGQGYDIINSMRESRIDIPIIAITKKSETSERTLGLSIGADDYIIKPFEPLEAAAKVDIQLRKRKNKEQNPPDNIINAGGLALNCSKCCVEADGKTRKLTMVEFKVLELFMRFPNRIFTKEQICLYGWGSDCALDDNTIRVVISRIRKKIGNNSIKTVRGLGYRLE